MTSRRRALLAVAAIAALATGFAAMRHRPAACPDADECRAAPTATAKRAGDAPPVRSFGPLPEGDFDRTRSLLESRALAGDPASAYRLAEVIGRCRTYTSMSDGVFARLLASAAGMLGALRIDGERIGVRDAIDLIADAKADMDALCSGTEATRASMQPADAFRWNHRAAMLGDTRAMAAYADYAFTEFPTSADLMDHAAEVARRRVTARAMLERALQAGEPTALKSFSAAHSHTGWLQRDPVLALSYWDAYRRTSEGHGLSAVQAAIVDRHLRNRVGAAGEREAQRRAADLLARYFPGVRP